MSFDLFAADAPLAPQAVDAFAQEDMTAPPPGWPEGGLQPHPFAALNRMMIPAEHAELKASIAANGLRERIVMFEDKILDGRNRFLICVELGRFPANVDFRNHPDFIVFGSDRWDRDRGDDALSFVWDMDVRRHRSAKDTALAAARYLRFLSQLKPEPLPGSGPGQPLYGKTAKLRLPTQADIARRHGISERLVHSALNLLERAEPEVIQAVEEDRLSLTDAAEVVSRLEPEEQRFIAAAPDRKAGKAKVRAAAKKKPAPAPELPAPTSRAELANFAEVVINEAHRVAKAHVGRGASMSADMVLNIARNLMLIERGDEFGFTRPMLLALGKLRDMPETSPPKPEKADTGPESLPLGGEWTLKVGGLKGRDTASIGVFHEEDDTYSINSGFQVGTSGSAGPYYGAYPDFRTAIGAAAARLVSPLRSIEAGNWGACSDAMKASAKAGANWLEAKLKHWGIEIVDPVNETAPSSEGHEGQEAQERSPESDGRSEDSLQAKPPISPAAGDEHFAEYRRLIERAAHLVGKHTRVTAEPILRAGDAAGITRQKMADDTGIPLGSVAGWCNRLGLQKPSRNPTLPKAGREGLSA